MSEKRRPCDLIRGTAFHRGRPKLGGGGRPISKDFTMPHQLDSVKELARIYERVAADREREGDQKGAASFLETSESLDWIVNDYEKLLRWAMPVPSSYGDTSDLPPELLIQLSGVKTDGLEDQIYAIIKASGDGIDTDHLLIELYRRSGDVHERRYITNKIYRMTQKDIVHSVAGRKGVYSIHPQPSAPAKEADKDDALPPPEVGPREHFPADLDDEIPF